MRSSRTSSPSNSLFLETRTQHAQHTNPALTALEILGRHSMKSSYFQPLIYIVIDGILPNYLLLKMTNTIRMSVQSVDSAPRMAAAIRAPRILWCALGLTLSLDSFALGSVGLSPAAGMDFSKNSKLDDILQIFSSEIKNVSNLQK